MIPEKAVTTWCDPSCIGGRLREERIRLGYAQGAFAAIGGASRSSQLGWEGGRTTPNAGFLHLVARAGVDVLYVVTGERAVTGLSVEEAAMLAGYRQLRRVAKNGVLELIGSTQP